MALGARPDTILISTLAAGMASSGRDRGRTDYFRRTGAGRRQSAIRGARTRPLDIRRNFAGALADRRARVFDSRAPRCLA